MNRLAPQRPKPVTERRICLGCDRSFDSEGPWNRICKRCARAERRLPDSREGAGAAVPPGVLADLLGAEPAGERL